MATEAVVLCGGPLEHRVLGQHKPVQGISAKIEGITQRLIQAATDYLKQQGITWFTPEASGNMAIIYAPFSGTPIEVCNYNPDTGKIKYNPVWQ